MAYSKELWIEAKKKCRLNEEDIMMAKEMGLNPKSLIKNIPGKNQQWKAPVKEWIRDMYFDRFGVDRIMNNSNDRKTKKTNPDYEEELPF